MMTLFGFIYAFLETMCSSLSIYRHPVYSYITWLIFRTQNNGFSMHAFNLKALAAAGLTSAWLASPVAAIDIYQQGEGDNKAVVSIGGYVKMDIRHVNGDIAYQDYWVANYPGGEPTDTSHTGFNVRESRVNLKVDYGDITGFVEIDFYGGGGNEIISNSSNPRLRHLYFTYKNWTAGQAWSTFMPVRSMPETLDFGGPFIGEAFMRAVLVRYTYGNWEFALENPETWGDGDIGTPSSAIGLSGDDADPDESIPDFVTRYTHNADWGWVALAGMVRQVDEGGIDETAFAANIAGLFKVFGRDDFRFQITGGEPGRYASAAMTPDIVINPATEDTEVEQTLAYSFSYRHHWNDSLRSTAYYGTAETDVLEKERSQWGVNLIKQVNQHLKVGVEYGNYAIDDEGILAVDSDYLQVSAQMSF